MSAAILLQAWADTMVTTGVLVALILLIRKPFSRHFGPGLAYALWLVPALRLILPPLPFGDPVVINAAPIVSETPVVAGLLPVSGDMLADVPTPLWTMADLLPIAFALWAVGAAAVLGVAMLAHRRFRHAVLDEAVVLEPLGDICVVMSDAVDGPVAFGMVRRFVAVPHDFFARYAADERALAIDHELAHHRHGDLWANGAALLMLAAQWINPFAWRAIRAFRFDQEAACDARVLTMAGTGPRDVRTARYATAIAKAAVGSRLSLAAPMAVHDNLQERLTMLLQQDISKKRGFVGRLLVGGAAVAVLATTATLVPSGIAIAQPAQPPAPPAAPAAPKVMIITSDGESVTEDVTTSDDGTRREVRRVVIRRVDKDGETQPSADAPAAAAPQVRSFQFAMPGGLSRDDILATLKEQGVTGKRAEAIADKLEARRTRRVALAPIPPMPPVPPVPPFPVAGWAPAHGQTMLVSRCRDGKQVAPLIEHEEKDGNKRSRVVMLACHEGAAAAARISALKKARESFTTGQSARNLSAEIRAKVAADLDKAIADLERSAD